MSRRRDENHAGPQASRRRTLVEALEPRILLAADLAAGLLDEDLTPQPDQSAQQELVLEGAEATLGTELHAGVRELVFLDAGLEDSDQLIADLLEGRQGDGTQVTVVMLDSERDGLDQIGAVLAASEGRYDAVHVVSHGTERGVQLGSTWFDAETLAARAGDLTAWGDSFGEDADLLLYGCDLAASDEGRALVDDLALLTGADVAASVDLTGAVAKGGDWDLEYTAGEVETDVVFSGGLQLGYQHVLGGTAIWAEFGSNVPETADFDGASFESESQTQAVAGEWRVISGVASETRDEMIVTGIADDGKLSTLRWDGTSWTHDGTWSWSMSDPTDHGLDLAYESQSGDAMLVFNDGFNGIRYTVWDGSSWTPVASVPQAEAGEASHIKLASDPFSDEIIMIVSNEFQEDYTAVWDGSSWGNAIDLHNSGNPVGHTDVNVVYEQQSGDAMLVWGENDDRIHYRIWDGTSFSSEMTLDPPAGVNGDVAWTAVAADPNSDRIALAVGTDNGFPGAQDAWLAVWDGSVWNAPVKTATDTPHGDRQAVAVAFESTTGQALAAYATGGDIAYQTWTSGSGWSGEQAGPDVGGHPDTVILDADPGSDQIMLSVVDQGKDVSFTLWDGSGWGTPSVQEIDAGTNKGQPFLFLWDREMRPNAAPTAVVDSAAVTQGASVVIDVAANDTDFEGALDLSSITITSGPARGTLVDNGDGTLTYTHDGSSTPGDSFTYTIDDAEGATSNAATVSITVAQPSTAALWFSTDYDVSGSGAPGLDSWDDGAVVAFDPTSLGGTTSGSFSKVFDLDVLAADGNADVDALHYVRSAITVGGANAIELLPGDVILSTVADETLLGTSVTDGDVVVFRPSSSDYSSGSVFTLLDIAGLSDVQGIALVEEDTTIGGVDLAAGSFLYRSSSNGDVMHFTADDVGAGTTAGTSSVLIDASAIGLTGGNYLSDFTLISSPTSIGGVVLSPGQLLISTSWYDTVGGIATNPYQIIALDVTTAGPGTEATASVLFDGPQVGIGSPGEKIFPFTLTGEVNAAPVLTPAAPSLPTLSEGAPGGAGQTIDSILGASVTDADAGALTGLAITDLDSGNGTWEVSTDGGTGWVAVGAASNTSALLLRATDRIRFVPAADGADTATFSFRAWDQTLGEPGTPFDVSLNGGTTAFSANTDVATVDVLEVNEAPTATDATVDVDEDGLHTLTLADFGYADPDGDSLLNVIVGSVSGAGVLRDGATVLTGGETISATSIAAGQVTFTPVANENGAGYASFTFQVQDDGGTANGGVELSAAPNTLTFDVTSINDAPSGSDLSLDLDEDGPHVFTTADFGYADAVEGDDFVAVVISSISGGGTLREGATVLTGGETVSVASILAGDLVYTPGADEHGSSYASIGFQVQDDGGTADGGVDVDPTPNTIEIDVASVNDAPDGADTAIALAEDGSHTLTLADFGFSDAADGDALQSVVIDTVTGSGTLRAGATLLTGGETVSAALISGGGLVFTPAAEASGVAHGGFTFRVQDDGGTTNGGIDTDLAANAIQFDVTSVNDAPSGTDRTVAIDEDGSHTFTLADFGFSDGTEGDTFLELVIGSVTGSGTLTDGVTVLSGGETVSAAAILAGDLVFTPVAEESGSGYAGFTFQVRDDGGTANGGQDLDPTANAMSVDVRSVNDAPSGSDAVLTLDEDGSRVLTLADFGFSDPVDGDAFLEIVIGSVSGGGVLQDGATVLSGGEAVTAASIQAGSLVFTPGAGESGAGYASFSFQVRDDGGTADGGVDLDPSANTLQFDVTSLNDAPDGSSRSVTLIEDGSYAFTVADFGFSDAEGDSLLEVAIGTISGGGVLRDGATVLTGGETVSVASIVAGDLVFTPTSDENGAGYASFTFQVRDDGGTAGGGVDLDPVANVMTLDVTSVNDEPAGADRTVTTGEDTPYVFTVSDFGLSDPLDGDGLATVVLGTVSGSGTWRDGATVLTGGETVSAASITAGNLTFTPVTSENGASYASFTFQVQDDGGTADGGVDLDATPNTITVDVSAVNNAPSGADTTVLTNEDQPRVFTLSDFGFTDPADGHTLHEIEIGTVSGSGTLRNGATVLTGGETVSAGAIAAGDLIFTPVGDESGSGYASFTFQVRDSGGTANGGVDLDPTPNTVTIDVNAVNDAPTGADATLVLDEDGSRTVTTADLGFSDGTEGDLLVGIVIDAVSGGGTLRDGATVLTGGETVSAASVTAGNLVFTPDGGDHGNGYAAFSFSVQDDGGTLNGGVDTALTPNTITFDVTSVNDAPQGADHTVTILEGQTHVFAVSDFGFSDGTEGDAFAEIVIGTVVSPGKLYNGATELTGGETVTVAEIAAGDLFFVPVVDAHAAAHGRFTFQVRDDGGTADGGVDLDPTARMMTIDVTSVNDAPDGADLTISTAEDTDHVFTLADFGFTDAADGDAFLEVVIAGLNGGGCLMEGAIDVSGGGTVTAASIAAGNLVFVPTPGQQGTSYADFDFQVRDDGGTADGGQNLDPTANTITIDVTSVNDAPSGQDRTVNLFEDAPYTVTVADLGFSDGVEGDSLLSIEIGSVLGGGSLQNGGTALTGGETVTLAELLAGDLVFTPTPGASGAAHGSFTFQVRDDGGLPGVDLDPTPNTMRFDVASVNDAPDGADLTVSTAEDVPYTFTVADFGFDDGTEGDAFQSILITNLTGGGVLRNDGVVLTGGETISVADISAGRLVLTPASEVSGAGHAGFDFQVRDDGGTANGGVDLDPTAATMTVDVTAVNDAPSGTDVTLSTLEDTVLVLNLADFGFTDLDSNAFLDVLITNVSGTGTLRDGATILTGGETVTAATVGAGNLTYTPGADINGNGVAAFDFQVRDDGGVAGGGVDRDPTPNTVSIDVTSVNDAPSGTDATVTIDEDGTYVFSIADFGFTDPLDGNNFRNLRITTGPGAGTLRNGAIVLTGGENVSRAAINAGDLTFTPDPDASGTGYASFQFQVRDRGGQANGGVNIDGTPNTMTVDVSAANDAPQLSAAGPTLATLNEDQTNHAGIDVGTLVGGSITDVDPGAALGIAVTHFAAGAGHFEYSTDGGASWSAVGSVSTSSALLLGDTDRVRFVPDAKNGSIASLDYRAWDRTSGTVASKVDTTANGATTAFSTAVDQASVTVSSLNDAPRIGDGVLPAGSEGGATVNALFGATAADVDAGSSLAGVALIGNPSSPATGSWEYSTDGGANWAAVGAVSDGAMALALDPSARLRFAAASGYAGEVPQLQVRGLDDTYGGGFSSTAGGGEVRALVNTSGAGGTSAISASVGRLAGEALLEVTPPPATIDPEVADPTTEGLGTEIEAAEEAAETQADGQGDAVAPAAGDPDLQGGLAALDSGNPEPVSLGLVAPALPDVSAGPSLAFASSDAAADEAAGAEFLGSDERRDPGGSSEEADFTLGPKTALHDLFEGFNLNPDFLVGDSAFLRELDRMREAALGDEGALEEAVVGSSAALSAGLSIGYVIWLTRGGLLIASLASSIPVWRLVDPIPVLASLALANDDEGESLDSMVEGGAERETDPDAPDGPPA